MRPVCSGFPGHMSICRFRFAVCRFRLSRYPLFCFFFPWQFEFAPFSGQSSISWLSTLIVAAWCIQGACRSAQLSHVFGAVHGQDGWHLCAHECMEPPDTGMPPPMLLPHQRLFTLCCFGVRSAAAALPSALPLSAGTVSNQKCAMRSVSPFW